MMPGWNCHVKVEQATTVGLGWAVTDDVPGDPKGYTVDITLTLPERAGVATIVSQKKNENPVVNRDPNLTCGPNGIEAVVKYCVSPATGTGSQVLVKVCKNAGIKPPPPGDILGQAAGQIGQDISFHFLIPGTCA